MTKSLDVLVLESQPHAADRAAATLERAGHRVHRCHDDGDRGFPCRGVLDPSACPVGGPLDVALVVRPRVNPKPTRFEGGMSCAIRAGVPIVEDGPGALDPFEPWVNHRLERGGDVAAACTEVARQAWEPLRHQIVARISALLGAASIEPTQVRCHLDRAGTALDVHLFLPVAADRGFQQALAVRVLDAVHSGPRTFGQVDVHVHTPENVAPT